MSSRWLWGPALLREFEWWGVPWEIRHRPLTQDEIGASPGGCYWDGFQIVFEHTIWKPWVAHELAHYIVTKRDKPEFLGLRNWGTEQEEPWDDQPLEDRACDVNIAILIMLRLPWRQAAGDLSIPENNGVPYSRSGPTETQWRHIRAAVLRKAAPYLQSRWPTLAEGSFTPRRVADG